MIYIRYGEPSDRALDVSADIPSNESWLYYESVAHPRLMFHFYIDANAVGNNWRLVGELDRDMLESRLTWDNIFQRLYMSDEALEYI